jgi:hypothetical protein
MFLGTSMLWKKQLIGWRRTNGSTLIVLIDESSNRRLKQYAQGDEEWLWQ